MERFHAGKERIYANAQMGSREIRKYCELGTDAEHLLERAMVKQGLSARAHDRILKVSRTVADLAAAEESSRDTLRRRSSTGRWTGPSGHRGDDSVAMSETARTITQSVAQHLGDNP